MSVDDIIPKKPSPFELALGKAFSDTLPVPIREAMDPARTPLAILPFLAVHRGVRLWYSDWSEARRRQMAQEAPELAGLVGTQAAAARFLAFVDAEIIDKVSYPRPFVIGRSPIGAPIAHPPFQARYLVKLPLTSKRAAHVIGRSPLGRAALLPVDLEPIRRMHAAFTAAKAPETEYSVTPAWRRPITLGDGFPLDGSFSFGDFKDRMRLLP